MSALAMEQSEVVTHDKRPVIWRPTPKQSEFISAPQREVLMGGGIGSGKSEGLLMAAAAATGNKYHRAVLLRRSFPQARDLILKAQELYGGLGAIFNSQTSTFVFPSKAR